MSGTTYDVRFWKIEVRPNRRAPYRPRWVVAGRVFTESFVTRPLADSFRSELITAAKKGEAFDLETGLPVSLLRKRTDVSFLAHAREYVAVAWKDAAAKSRISILETLTRGSSQSSRGRHLVPPTLLYCAKLYGRTSTRATTPARSPMPNPARLPGWKEHHGR